MDLDSLKYADLRQLAKSVGLKANMKADKLLKALKEHFEQKESSPNGNDVTDVQASSDVMVDPTTQKVTMRRGKTMNAKRKHLEEPGVIAEEKPVLADAVPAETENERRRSSKRRKVSSTKDTENPVSNGEPENLEPEIEPVCSKDAATEKNGKDERKKIGKIPRHAGLMKRAALKPTTPNFKKLHQAQFDKMESIDSYLHRKNKPIKIQVMSSSEKLAMVKAGGKPPISRASLFSPGLLERTAEKRRVTSTGKSALKTSRVFKPTVLSSNKINVRFSQATQDNEHKRSLMKTPSRMSPMVALTPTPGRKSEGNTRSSTLIKTPGMTTFVFGGSSTPATNKKNAFDLKASLSRPLNYKPHKGKLKPFQEAQENMAPNKMQTAPSHQKNIKQHQVQTREDRRVKHTKDRKQKKEKMLDARRGLVMT